MPDTLRSNKRRLISWLFLLLALGFLVTSLVSYYVSKSAIRAAIVEKELPLTSDTIYSEIQKDLIRPVFVSSMMASDTFLRDWVIHGESDVAQITKYLKEVKERYGAFTSFFVSEHTRIYYHTGGILKKVREDEPRDAWYFRVRNMQEPYEINVDPDLANKDAMTIFINYRVFDYSSRYIGAIGVGLTVDAVRTLINEYQTRYQRDVYFVDARGNIVLYANRAGEPATNIRAIEGLGSQTQEILHRRDGIYLYEGKGKVHHLNVRFIPELKWYLFVEKTEDEALMDIKHALWLNVAICVCISIIVLLLTSLTIRRYQRRLEEMATTDSLTGLLNRHAFDTLMTQAINESKRAKTALAVLLIDADHFKVINDTYGHLAGDQVLGDIVKVIQANLRLSDIFFRWGGEEFLIILRECGLPDARAVAEKLRAAVEETSFAIGSHSAKMTISVGCAVFREGSSIDALIAGADMALYEAKNAGRNRVACDPAATTLS